MRLIRSKKSVPKHASQTPEVYLHPSKRQALETMQDRQIVHFACQGHADLKNPPNSHLLLRDDAVSGQADQITVTDMVETSSNTARLAYLSACSTAENLVPKLLDESIHLAATFQLAEFAHVIATLWSVGDDAAIKVAEPFYADLLSRSRVGVIADKSVSYARYEAVRVLRERRNLQDGASDLQRTSYLGCHLSTSAVEKSRERIIWELPDVQKLSSICMSVGTRCFKEPLEHGHFLSLTTSSRASSFC